MRTPLWEPSSAAATRTAAEAWGGENPWGMPFFIVTHRPAEAPADAGFEFVDSLDEAIARAREAVGEKDVFVMGGADVIRQALRGGNVEEPRSRSRRSS